MDISVKMQDAINGQIKEEFDSAYIYLAMAAYFEDQNLPGFSAWMKKQYQEELEHAHKFFDYLFERQGRSFVPAIAVAPVEWDSPLAAFKAALAHEKHITKCIHDLVFLAREEKDLASESFLQWYVNEQVEEEVTANEIIVKLEMVSDSKYGLYMLDKELGQR